jgi:hypothetical protein
LVLSLDIDRFSDVTGEGRPLAAEQRQHAQHEKPRNQADKGD